MSRHSGLPDTDKRELMGIGPDASARAGIRRALVAYGVAVAAVAVAMLLRWLLNPVLGHRFPLATVCGAVAVAVWFGGWKPGLLATGLAFVVGHRLFIKTDPDAVQASNVAVAITGLALYLGSCLIIIGFGSGMRAARRRAEAHAHEALARQDLLEREAIARQRAEEALREADRHKDEFLAILAHELANSLAPMSHALELMRRGAGDHQVAHEARQTMERQVRNMTELVNDLRDLARIKSGNVRLRKEPVDLAAAVQHAVEKSRPLMEAFDHQLTLTLPTERVCLHADATRLAQVFSNLLNNAAKYTERGGQISLTACRENGEAIVRVRDTGIGISADQLPAVFEIFTQAAPASERSQTGLGIGLSLVRRLVELHGGHVHVRSDGPGKGSEFVVRLPVQKGN
jgi:signal transduction histidine kinase